MLNSMRALSKGYFAKFMLLCIIVMFVVWGVGDILRSSGPSYAAKVGNETITIGEFQQHKAMLARQLQAMGMQGMDTGKLDVAALRQMIQEKLTLLSMRDMGLFVNDTLVAQRLRAIPELKNKDGSFNKAAFMANLANQRVSEGSFIAQLKKETAGRFLIDSLSMDDATPPASVMALDAVTRGETRDAVLITIPARATAENIGEEKLKEYYEQNKAVNYLLPETRTLEYVTITPAEIGSLVDKSITEDRVKEAMAASPNQAKTEIMKQLQSEQRDTTVRTLTNTVEDELAAGKTIGEAFAKAGLKSAPRALKNVTIDDAKKTTDEVAKTAEEQGFTLSEGEISNLISTPKGTMLMVAVTSIIPAKPNSFEAVKADVKKRMAQQQTKELARNKAIEVKDALSKDKDWQAALAKFSLSSRTVSGLARPTEGKATADSRLPASIHQAIFEHGGGEVAGPLTLENGDQLLALVTAVHHPKIDPSAVSRSNAGDQSARLTQDIQNRAFNAMAEKYRIKVNPAALQRADDTQP